MKPHHIKTFHWRDKAGWCSNEWPWRLGTKLTNDNVMWNLRHGWTMVATLNNGQKVIYRCRS